MRKSHNGGESCLFYFVYFNFHLKPQKRDRTALLLQAVIEPSSGLFGCCYLLNTSVYLLQGAVPMMSSRGWGPLVDCVIN